MTLASPDPDKAPTDGDAPTISVSDRIGAVSTEATVKTGPAAPVVSLVTPVVSTSSHVVVLATPELTASRDAPGVPPAPPVAPTVIPDVRPPIAPQAAAVFAMPPPPPGGELRQPPPPPSPVTSPAVPGAAGQPGRKPLVGPRIDRTAAATPMPSAIMPSETGRRRPRGRSRAARSSFVVMFDGLISLLTICAVLAGLAWLTFRHEFEQPGPLAANKTVLIPPKRSRDDIADILEKANVVSDKTFFYYGSIIAQISDMKAGEYEFKAHATMREVAESMQQGHFVRHKITFPEGWTSEQIVQRLLDDPILTGKITAIPEEGSLEPNTYLYTRGDSREGILAQMKREQERHLTEIWAHRNAELLNKLKVPKDLVILASIVEKETSRADERPRIAAVFVNRLNKGMRLETDPTILYGLYGGKAWQESRTITRADLNAPNPYNTYKINGLPPGPIGNPGRAALEAAANPSISNELFFVADGTGGHVFAETFEDHKKNVERWREIERSRKAADPNAPASPGPGTGIQSTPPAAVVAPGTPLGATLPGQKPAAKTTVKPTTQAKPPKGTAPADPTAPVPVPN